MVLLRMLNVLAPVYFLCLLSVTLCLQLFLLLPSTNEESTASLPLSSFFHSSLFMFFLVNVLGNYILVIWNSPGASGHCKEVEISETAFCQLCTRVMWEKEHHCFFTGTCIGRSNLRSFVLFCLHCSCSCFHSMVSAVGYISESFSLSFYNPVTFLKLLPLSVTRFFSGSLLSSDMLLVLMIYLWFGVGLACAAFCCHQLLLISRGPTCQPFRIAQTSIPTWSDNLQRVFGKRWLLALLVPQPRDK
ncbi:palmitoyltransferase ZDHHC22 [Rhinophrynus dorsalis]